ncbi:hypothetical protein AVHY2522_24730 [Acidovorax sp. SUPP2522]|uniref:hypothetical protein n=1 Tax=unclassified Acidovorax TaxID=2684926 RepID=UPI002349DE6A|nr:MULTISPECIES: hypothetical protein [unclassified Acidovorax]WCM98325.1 hypothetical protein M5C96_02330 [Acidovorax sp. GBBC 1281]GKT20077.1 hypothetical protein AVHY2522_24730 [Acidovorax sp. SUPP2522]
MRVVWAACIALQALGYLGHQDGVGHRLVSSRLQDQYQKTYLGASHNPMFDESE